MSKRGAVRVGVVLVLVCVGIVVGGLLLSRAGMRSEAEDAWTELVLQQDKDGYRGCVDTRIYAAAPNENHGCTVGEGDAWCELQVGERGKPPVGDSHELRSLVRFEVPACAEDAPDGPCIPVGASICEATLALYAHNAGQVPEVPIVAGAYEVLRAWDEMEGTWNMATASDAWEVEGCNGDTDRSAEPLDETEIDRRDAWYEWDVTPAVVRWLEDPDSNKGLIVLQTDDCDIPPGCEWDIRHSEYGGKPERPKLIVRYASEPSKIVVVKQAIGGDGTFTFTSNTLTPPTFTLTTVDGTASREFDGLTAGSYDVTESDPGPGWELLSATCDDGSDPSAISLDCGETVTCTFVDRIVRGKIVVVKQTIGGDDTFTFTSDTLTPPTFTLTTVGGTASREFDELMPGTYDVAESEPPPGWRLATVYCDDGSEPSAISLDAGETVTCTFTDTMTGKIVVVKNAVGGDAAFTFISQTLTPPTFTLTTVDGTASREFDGLTAGTYDVAESDPGPDWELQEPTCDDGSPPSAISLDAGETVTCTFENRFRRYRIHFPLIFRGRLPICIPQCEGNFLFHEEFDNDRLEERGWTRDLVGGFARVEPDSLEPGLQVIHLWRDDDSVVFPLVWHNGAFEAADDCFCLEVKFRHREFAGFGTTVAVSSKPKTDQRVGPPFRIEGIEDILSAHQKDGLFEVRLLFHESPPRKRKTILENDVLWHTVRVTLAEDVYRLYWKNQDGSWAEVDADKDGTSPLRPTSIHFGSHTDQTDEPYAGPWTELFVDYVRVWPGRWEYGAND
jgi:hypothetical protein